MSDNPVVPAQRRTDAGRHVGARSVEATPAAHVTHLVYDQHRSARRQQIRTELAVAVLTPDAVIARVSADLLDALRPASDTATSTAAGPPTADLDHALRVDMLVRGWNGLKGQHSRGAQKLPARTQRDGGAAAFLVRSGPLQLTDADLAWWRAVRAACGVVRMACAGLYVATATGWLEVARGTTMPLQRHAR